MRFRATIEHVDTFIRIIQSVEKLQKRCTIKFGEQEIRVICTGDVNEGGIQVWSQIKVSSIFTEYRIQSNSNNEITITVSSEALLAVLRSAAGPSSTKEANNPLATNESQIVMKLAKNQDRKSVLSFVITRTTSSKGVMEVTQQLLIDVLRHAEVERLREPTCPEPDVHILLPPLAKFRGVVDRLRSLAQEGISFRANYSGVLQLGASTDDARVEITWRDLSNPPMADDPAAASQKRRDVSAEASTQQSQLEEGDEDEREERDLQKMHGVVISHKSLLRFLNSHVISTTTIACICEGVCMILYVYIGDISDAGGVLTFYIPAQLDGNS